MVVLFLAQVRNHLLRGGASKTAPNGEASLFLFTRLEACPSLKYLR